MQTEVDRHLNSEMQVRTVGDLNWCAKFIEGLESMKREQR